MPTATLPSQMEVDDYQIENQLDITLHQPLYQTPNLNITLTQENLLQQLDYNLTQVNPTP